MRRHLWGLCGFAALSVAATSTVADEEPDLVGCSYLGLDLYGEVILVSDDPDVRVEIVQKDPDIRVQWVNRHAGSCGYWRLVGLGADFRVQIVPENGDIKIQEVESNPGLP